MQRFFSIQVIFHRPVLACQSLTINTWQDKKCLGRPCTPLRELQPFAQVNHAQSPRQFNLIMALGGSKTHSKWYISEKGEITLAA